ncbi:hornerin-like [Iris pallida]|uniref:Hornerin-like n=1 Tax=Iris pallida TaxID=29817 RepID=A0AAX6EHE1_IRIPA|nr:hornerin-like [Iris pallida]
MWVWIPTEGELPLLGLGQRPTAPGCSPPRRASPPTVGHLGSSSWPLLPPADGCPACGGSSPFLPHSRRNRRPLRRRARRPRRLRRSSAPSLLGPPPAPLVASRPARPFPARAPLPAALPAAVPPHSPVEAPIFASPSPRRPPKSDPPPSPVLAVSAASVEVSPTPLSARPPSAPPADSAPSGPPPLDPPTQTRASPAAASLPISPPAQPLSAVAEPSASLDAYWQVPGHEQWFWLPSHP